MMHDLLTIIAQASPAPADPNAGKSPGSALLFGFLLMIAVFYFVLFRGNRRQQRERQDLLTKLTKNDRVMTVGGIVGTVIQVRDNEVVLKVDETNNTKITFLKTAIQRVLQPGESPPNS